MLRAIARGRPSPVWRRYLSPTDPAPGANLVIPAATGRVQHVLSITCLFSASVAVAARDVILAHLDGDNRPIGTWPLTASLAASDTKVISWQAGLGALLVGSSDQIAVPLAPLTYVFPGESLIIAGTNDADDQISAVRGVVIETDNGDTAYEDATQQSIVDHANAIRDLIGA